jgi:hypothetical protein
MDVKEDVCIRELRAILICDQSDGYLKERARYWIEVIEHNTRLVADPNKVPALVS